MARDEQKFQAHRDDMPWRTTEHDQPESIEEALAISDLDWEVLPKPAYFLDNVDEVEEADDPDDIPLLVEPVPNTFFNVRSDTGQPLGPSVTGRYSHFHNIQAFGFLSEIFGTEMDFVAGGHFMHSRRVWVMLRIPDFIEVGGDRIGQYAFIHTSHDGKHSVTASMTPFRWLSKTLITAEIRKAKNSDAPRVIALRHVGNMEVKIEEARRVLDVSMNYYKQFADLGNKLAKKRPTQADRNTYVEALLPIDEDKMGDRAQANALIARDQIIKLDKATKDNGGGSPGTWWSLYNAAIEFSDWVRPERKKDGRFQRSIDDPDGFKSLAWEMALGGAGL
jgi:phage/plasmid-like protein (TIGR03299 family)